MEKKCHEILNCHRYRHESAPPRYRCLSLSVLFFSPKTISKCYHLSHFNAATVSHSNKVVTTFLFICTMAYCSLMRASKRLPFLGPTDDLLSILCSWLSLVWNRYKSCRFWSADALNRHCSRYEYKSYSGKVTITTTISSSPPPLSPKPLPPHRHHLLFIVFLSTFNVSI